MTDLFLLIVDRDCNRENHAARAQARDSEHHARLLACLAVQELEVWLLALYRTELGVRWPEVREECDPKERFAEPLLQSLGHKGAGGGRKQAMQALRGQLPGLLALCDELGVLRGRIAEFVSKHPG